MLFSSLVFIYAFLPIVVISYFLIRNKFKNRLLLIGSLIFFAWGGVSYTLLLIGSLVLNYITGILIDKASTNILKKKIILGIGVALNLLFLGIFKYADFIIENINFLNSILGWRLIDQPGIILPLGISFYTFQAMSYIIDVYRGDARVQRNFFKLALYISFFPQLIAGPIVRYNLIEDQLSHRKNHFGNLSAGIQRFVLGLSKKVLLANQFGIVADQAFSIPFAELSTETAWIGVLAYTMQIYFDFSGYSDMAIGLGRMFGFKFPENFNFPYMSTSIREFWTRWHMTLGQWFKNYLYFPLGGSRKGPNRTIINLLIVFFATSVWHGASWNFIIWGMTHGFFMMLERLGLEKLVSKLWRPFQHLYAMFIISVTRVFFRADTFDYAIGYFKRLFSINFDGINIDVIPLVNNNVFYLITIIGILSCFPFWYWLQEKFQTGFSQIRNSYLKTVVFYTKELSLLVSILVGMFLCTMILLGDTYNPFIYFRF